MSCNLRDSVPTTIKEFNQWLNLNFKCVLGSPTSVYDSLDSSGIPKVRKYLVLGLTKKIPHRTFPMKMSLEGWKKYRDKGVKDILKSLHGTFVNYKHSTGLERPTLVERQRLEMDVMEELIFDMFGTMIPKEDIEDRIKPIPYDYDLDWEAGVYRKVIDRRMRVKVTYRFDIPDLSEGLLRSGIGFKQEGYSIPAYEDFYKETALQAILPKAPCDDHITHDYMIKDPNKYFQEQYLNQSHQSVIKNPEQVPMSQIISRQGAVMRQSPTHPWQKEKLNVIGAWVPCDDRGNEAIFYSKEPDPGDYRLIDGKRWNAVSKCWAQDIPNAGDVNPFARIGSKHNPLTEQTYVQLIANGYKDPLHLVGFQELTEDEKRLAFKKARQAGIASEYRSTKPPLAGFNKISKL